MPQLETLARTLDNLPHNPKVCLDVKKVQEPI